MDDLERYRRALQEIVDRYEGYADLDEHRRKRNQERVDPGVLWAYRENYLVASAALGLPPFGDPPSPCKAR